MFNSTKISKLDDELKASQSENEKLKAKLAALESGIAQISAKAEGGDDDEEAKKARKAKEEEDEEAKKARKAKEEEDEKAKKAKGKKAKSEGDGEGDEDEDAKAALAKISGHIDQLTTKVSALEKSIDARVSSTLASMGIEPIARDPKAKDDDNSNLSGLARASAGMRVAE
jgi:chromosome segregation ATPase